MTLLDQYEGFLSIAEANELHDWAWTNLAWQDDNLGRKVCWIGPRDYSFYGVMIHHNPWPDRLRVLRDHVQSAVGAHFNTVLVNGYRTGHDWVDWHSDDEPELGTDPTIASLSVGTPRTFQIRKCNSHEQTDYILQPGCLIVMKGAFQRHWQHRVPPDHANNGNRINFTFRYWPDNQADGG